MAAIPPPIRASLGLLASVVDAAQALLDRAPELLERSPELPMELIGNAMQASLRAQQRYAEFIARGDELISHLRGVPDEPPAWATFDDDPVPRPAGTSDPAAGTDSPGTDSPAPGGEDEVAAPPPRHDYGRRTPPHGDPLLSEDDPLIRPPLEDVSEDPAVFGEPAVVQGMRPTPSPFAHGADAVARTPARKTARATKTTGKAAAAKAAAPGKVAPGKASTPGAARTAKVPAGQVPAAKAAAAKAAAAKAARPAKSPATTAPAATAPATKAAVPTGVPVAKTTRPRKARTVARTESGADDGRPLSAFDRAVDLPTPGPS